MNHLIENQCRIPLKPHQAAHHSWGLVESGPHGLDQNMAKGRPHWEPVQGWSGIPIKRHHSWGQQPFQDQDWHSSHVRNQWLWKRPACIMHRVSGCSNWLVGWWQNGRSIDLCFRFLQERLHYPWKNDEHHCIQQGGVENQIVSCKWT